MDVILCGKEADVVLWGKEQSELVNLSLPKAEESKSAYGGKVYYEGKGELHISCDLGSLIQRYERMRAFYRNILGKQAEQLIKQVKIKEEQL